MKNKLKIGELLIAAGVIDEEQLRQTFKMQEELGGTLGENLIRMGFASNEDILRALSEQMGMEHVNLGEVSVPVEIQKLVSWETVRRRRLLPIRLEKNILATGMTDPTDFAAISEVEFQSGHGVRSVILSSAHFERAVQFFDLHGYAREPLVIREESPLTPLTAASKITDLLKVLVAWRGQDLHLTVGSIPAIRMDNEMKRLSLAPLTEKQIETMVSSLLTPQQRRTFKADLELDFAYSLKGVGRFRCNVYRQRRTIAFTARHVADVVPSATELGLPGFLKEYALKNQGLILITGPNGHGKSTTLAYLVETVNREKKANIITIEDPIEFTHCNRKSNVNQREVGTDTHSFAAGLRHIFRQNPDVIVIGELRDHESFSIAVTAAETGHLVMATVHSINATTAVDRVIDMFPGDQQMQIRAQLADSLLLVFAQRLVKTASGAGRVLAWESMRTSARVKNAIREGKVHQLRNLMQTNVDELTSIDHNLAELVVAGKVTAEEAMKYADSATYLTGLLKTRGK